MLRPTFGMNGADDVKMISPSAIGQLGSIRPGDENPCRPTLYIAAAKIP
jgi:hypothetical protein